jgi:hypothetical protein
MRLPSLSLHLTRSQSSAAFSFFLSFFLSLFFLFSSLFYIVISFIMTFNGFPAAQPAPPSVVERAALWKRQDFVTEVFTTTVAFQTAIPTFTPLPDGTFTTFNLIEDVTEVITRSLLVSPEPTSVGFVLQPPSPATTSTVSSSIASSSFATSSAGSSSFASSSALPISSASPTPSSTSTFAPQPTQSETGSVAAANNSVDASSRQSNTLSAGAIAGIVIGVVVVLNVIGVLFYRHRQLARRKLRRATWKAGIRARSTDFSAVEKGFEPPAILTPFTLGLPGSNGRATRNSQATAGRRQSRFSIFNLPSALARSPEAAFPRDSFNPSRERSGSPSPGSAPTRPSRSEHRPSRKTPPPVEPPFSETLQTPAAAQVPTAVVRVTFIPTRPDELSVSIGQTLAVVHRFDDGWSLCANAYGEQGMVPLECLEGGGGQFVGFRDRSAMMRGSGKRASSLYPATGTSSHFADQ